MILSWYGDRFNGENDRFQILDYEYVAFPRPLICVGTEEIAMEDLLKGDKVDMFDYFVILCLLDLLQINLNRQ